MLSQSASHISPSLLNNSADLDSSTLNNYVPQFDAPEDLRVVSWPPWKSLAKLRSYLYNNDFPFAPMTYVIDIGVDTRVDVSGDRHCHTPNRLIR